MPFLGLSFLQYFENLFQFYKPSLNFFASIIGLLSTLISIAIPLTINKVADCLQPYKDREIQRMFIQDRTFQQMLFVILLLIFSLCFWFFVFDIMIIGIVLLSFGILSLFVFYQFLMRVIEYVTSTDEIVERYAIEAADNVYE